MLICRHRRGIRIIIAAPLLGCTLHCHPLAGLLLFHRVGITVVIPLQRPLACCSFCSLFSRCVRLPTKWYPNLVIAVLLALRPASYWSCPLAHPLESPPCWTIPPHSITTRIQIHPRPNFHCRCICCWRLGLELVVARQALRHPQDTPSHKYPKLQETIQTKTQQMQIQIAERDE
jgi:hypothetical protein